MAAITKMVLLLIDFAGKLLDLCLEQIFPRFRALNFFAFKRPLQHVAFSQFFDGLGSVDRVLEIVGLFHHFVKYLCLGRGFSLI